MIRVAFILHLSESWLGGLNYFRNLLSAIVDNSNMKITPVIFIGKNSNMKLLHDFPRIEMVKSDLFDRWTIAWIQRKINNKLLSRDYFLDKLFKQHKIDIVSHVQAPIGMETPQLGWIPDFQHIRLPHFFTTDQCMARDQSFGKLCCLCQGIILSSHDAQNDFLTFAPGKEKKTHVLQFVVQPPSSDAELTAIEIGQYYNFSEKYFYVPNQFWQHKNHKVLLKALRILKAKNHEVLIISTGSTEDSRMPEYFSTLTQFLQENQLSENFRVLGKVPYSHVVSFAKHCVALINPSLFEGWSTTVEEAKSLGKRMILSDIPVHREQNPPSGYYFDPHNPEQLADILWEVWQSNADDTTLKANAQQGLKQRRLDFAQTYERIIFDTLKVNK